MITTKVWLNGVMGTRFELASLLWLGHAAGVRRMGIHVDVPAHIQGHGVGLTMLRALDDVQRVLLFLLLRLSLQLGRTPILLLL
jgi:hypothetical protein